MTTADGAVMGQTKIVDNGPASLRWNVVILGDGYQSSELAQYRADAQTFADTLLSTAPFDTLRQAINVYRVDVSSTDSGADDPLDCADDLPGQRGTGATADTYLDATFCSSGLRRLLFVDRATVMAVADAEVPGWHVAFVLVNTPLYGGGGDALSRIAVCSMAPDAVEIALHELGHGGFGLADEYETLQGCQFDQDPANDQDHAHDVFLGAEPEQPNVTTQPDRSTLKWGDLVSTTTPIPTSANPDCTRCEPAAAPPVPLPDTVVGAFEGAHTFHCGAYRAQFTCRMRELGRPFCAVCQRAIRIKLRPFLPETSQAQGKVTFLLVQDVGRGFGPPDDPFDAEVIVQLDTEPGRSLGFPLRLEPAEASRRRILDTLRTAFNGDRLVRIDYRRLGENNAVLTSVTDLS